MGSNGGMPSQEGGEASTLGGQNPGSGRVWGSRRVEDSPERPVIHRLTVW